MTPFGRGAAFGLRLGVLIIVCESLWLLQAHEGASWRLVAMSLGVAVPAIGVLALGCGIAARGWSGGRVAELLEDGEKRREVMERPSASMTAWVLTGSLGVVVLAGATLTAGVSVLARVRTPALAVVLLGVLQLGAIAMIVLLAPAGHRFLVRFVGRLEDGKWAWVLTPRALVRAAALAIALACVGGFVALGELVVLLPWQHVVAPTAALVGAVLFEGVAGRGVERASRWGLLVSIAALGTVALLLPDDMQRWRLELVAHQSVARASLGVVRPLLDFDGDGALGFYGEADCARFDATRHPDRLEIAGNGVDEDCTGRDLTLHPGRGKRGSVRHGRPKGVEGKPNIVLVTTDALSQHHTSLGGHDRALTPELGAWAKRATVFEHAFSVTPETGTSFAATFTGRFPAEVAAMHERSWPRVTAHATTLAEHLSRWGYRTVAIVGTKMFTSGRWPQLLRGFEVVDEEAYSAAAKRYAKPKPHTSPELTERAIEALGLTGDQPLFLWVHYFDHHAPYSVPRGEASLGDGAVDKYDAELRFSDRHWGKLFEAVEERWRPEQYVLMFTADHGEAFDENHDVKHHAHCLRTHEVHVPLVVQTARRRGERVAGLVSHLDVLPTLLDVVGAETDVAGLRGESLGPVLFEGASPEKTVIVSSFFQADNRRYGGELFRQVSVRTRDLLLLHDRDRKTAALYRWPSDALERNDVASELPDEAEWARHLAKLHVRESLADDVELK